MGYQEIWQPYREEVEERFPLAMGRLEQIGTEETVPQPYRAYFRQAASFLLRLAKLEQEISSGEWEKKSLGELKQENMSLYREVLPEHYGSSYASPEHAGKELGQYGKLLGMLYADIRSLIPYAFEGRVYDITIFSELLVEIYNAFEGEELPEEREIQQILYWFFHDYGEIFTEIAVRAQTDPELDFYTRIIMDSDLGDLRYLYRYGAYITDNELKTAEFLNSLPMEKIQAMADTYTEGYRIYTSIDLDMQQMLQDTVDSHLAEFTEQNEEGIFALQGAAVCIDNHTGHVKAIVGGRNQNLPGYTLNRAYQSFRQPGSAIKPLLVYTPALEGKYTPDTIVQDVKTEEGPSNSSGWYEGDITLRRAVAASKNTVAWNMLEELTPQTGLAYLKNMKFSRIDPKDERPTSALGGFTNGVSAVEMASGYAAIVHDGKFREPTCITKITDADDNVILETQSEEVEIYKKNAARMMTDMLVSVLQEGTGQGLALSAMPSAGKTGTTNDNKDGWFVGYTSYYTTSVWVGYDMPRELPGLSGSSYPGGIWQAFMEQVHQGLEPVAFLPYIDENKAPLDDEEYLDGMQEEQGGPQGEGWPEGQEVFQ